MTGIATTQKKPESLSYWKVIHVEREQVFSKENVAN